MFQDLIDVLFDVLLVLVEVFLGHFRLHGAEQLGALLTQFYEFLLLGVFIDNLVSVSFTLNNLLEVLVVDFSIYDTVQADLHVLKALSGLGLVSGQLFGKVLLALIESVLNLFDVHFRIQRSH